MAINIGENNDKEVTYVNSPDINRVLFKNLSEGASADEIAEAVNAWIEEHPEAVTTVQDGSILPVKLDSSNEPSDGYVLSWNATAGKFEWIDIQSDITELKNDLTSIIADYANLSSYFYKANTYVNDSGVETALQGHNTYKINVEEGDIVRFSWTSLSTTPWGTLPSGHPINIHKTDDTYVNFGTTAGTVGRVYTANKEAIFVAPSNSDFVVMAVKPENAVSVRVEKNHPSPSLSDDKKLSLYNTVFTVNEQSAIKTQFYVDNTGKYQVLANTACVFALPMKNGDEAVFQAIPTGVSFRGTYLAQDGTSQNIGTIIAYPYTFKASSDGALFAFAIPNGARDTVIVPQKQIIISSKSVYGLDNGAQYNGLSGVAFGTSLTYNASIGNGFLTRLSTLSGITFDNQGVGSSTILGDGGSLDMLAKIKGYDGFSGKRVCLLEGFVNDWYLNNTLGTWKDNDETTVCGCVRSALNYILTQNANLTTFLILDHYGRNYNSLDCSSTATNTSGLTQFEYYSEIAKVAESVGIPVVPEYLVSQISENTPQYLADNIHLNALGALQSGNVIWGQMQNYPVNAT